MTARKTRTIESTGRGGEMAGQVVEQAVGAEMWTHPWWPAKTADGENGEAGPDMGVGPELEVVWVDPAAVQLDENVRTSPRLTEEFVETIRTQGVLAPVIAHRDLLGQVVVTDGQRRVLAARQAGLARIPAILAGDPGSPEARVVDQLTLNEARSPLTTSERAAAVQQLSLFGMEPETVARRIGVRRDQVADLLKVAAAPAAREMAAEVPELTISQAALLADIEASPVSADLDVLDTVAERIALDPGQADQVLELARRQVAYEEAFLEAEAGLDERGIAHMRDGEYQDLDRLERYKYAEVGRGTEYSRLVTPKGEPIRPEDHESCPGHVVILSANDHSADIYVRAQAWCRDHEKYGHKYEYQVGGRSAQRKPAGEETPEERAERARKAAERRHTIEMNRLSDSAQVVRDRYVLDLLAQRRAPKDAADFVVQILAGGEYPAWRLDVDPTELLRKAHALPDGVSAGAWAKSTPGGPERVLLAQAIGQCEAWMGRGFWQRNGSMDHSTWCYLRRLASWGYALSDIEREHCEAYEAAHKGAKR